MSLLQGFHKHHIIPRYLGGSDAPENLVLLHPIDHAIAHQVRYRMFGNIRDLWASNWLSGIVDPAVYTEFSKEREQAIKLRRQQDPEFDQHMKFVRSNATKNRKEGYQVEAGKKFKERFAADEKYSESIRHNRKLANLASIKVRQSAVADKAIKVRDMRASGASYKDIKKETGYSLASISLILNNKMLVGVGEFSNA